MKTLLSLAVVLLSCLVAVPKASGQTIGVSCPKFFDDRHQAIACAEALLMQDNYHFTFASVPPGNGFAPGLVLVKKFPRTSGPDKPFSEADVSATAARSTNGSWLVGGDIIWVPPLPYQPSAADNSLTLGGLKTTDRMSVHVSGMHRVAKTLSFYGFGPDSPSTATSFAQTDSAVEGLVRFPLTTWLAATGDIEVRQTTLQENDVAVLRVTFPAAAIPGTSTQPTYIHSAAGVSTTFSFRAGGPFQELPSQDDPHFQKLLLFTLDNRIAYHWQQPTDGSPFAFQQFVFSGDETMAIHSVLRNFFPADRHPIVRYVCQGNKRRDECDFGQVDVRTSLILTHASTGNQIPFYLQPTLGGSNIESEVTLRGYDDYRFRGPDLALLQVEYGVPLYDPIGLFVFYDAGTVGTSVSDLTSGRYRQDAGLGASIRLRGHIVIQGYYARGSGNGKWGYNFAKVF